jgi:hypothetical protein
MIALGYGRLTRSGVSSDPTRRLPSVMRRICAAIFAALIAVGLIAPASFAASPAAASGRAVPKVVFVVGPAGAATGGYRAQARAAASIARRYTPDVVEIYSPDATWPAVKAALDGASLVVYMGHGNGWPSRYRDDLFPPTQNGFGLNPSAGSGDTAHQYFGESFIGSQVELARNAIVLLNHLCYASGLTEPGLPVGTLSQAKQRVDNYAAGFIRAGAGAVIAEAYDSPSYMVRAILGGGRSIQAAWQHAPSANGHRLAFESERSRGYVAQMDMETSSSGYSRSIVMREGLAPSDVLAGAAGSAARSLTPIPLQPTLAGTGIKLRTPAFRHLPSAGSGDRLDVPFRIKDRTQLPDSAQASVRWDPIDVQVVPDQTAATPEPAADVGAAVDPAVDAVRRDPAAGSGPTEGDDPAAAGPETVTPQLDVPPDDQGLVVPEQVGDVVAPTAIKFTRKKVVIPVDLPVTPGRYRLTVVLHDSDGVAYDAATQAMLPSLIVRVTGEFDGSITAVPTAVLAAGGTAELGVRVANLGRTPWGAAAIPPASNLSGYVAASFATVVGRWIPLSAEAELQADVAARTISAALPIGLAPGSSAVVDLALTVPTAPGDYLLVLDVVAPDLGSLVATGVDPTLVRVTVAAPSDGTPATD